MMQSRLSIYLIGFVGYRHPLIPNYSVRTLRALIHGLPFTHIQFNTIVWFNVVAIKHHGT